MMADQSKIEWTDATWNVVNGCTLVSEGCKNCYAANLAATRLKNHPSRAGLARKNRDGVAKFTGEVRFNEKVLTYPLRWRRPRKIFVCAHGDLFHEGVPDSWIDQVFAVMALCPQHVFQVLTKRPERMLRYTTAENFYVRLAGAVDRIRTGGQGPSDGYYEALFNFATMKTGVPGPLPNVWLGVSAEDQATAEARIPALLETPAAVRFLSAEPLLGPIDLKSRLGGTLWIGGQRGCEGTHRHSGRAGEVIHGVYHDSDPRRAHHHHDDRCRNGLDWVIVGGESGHHARPMHPEWVRSLRDQCAEAHVPFLFKQWGNWITVYDRDVDDPDWRRCDVVAKANPKARWLNLEGGHGFHGARVVRVNPVKKGAAGRLLDGVFHDGFPQGAQ